jgi:hypothetical protein
MKKNGSVYVAVVFAALAGYFVYQWWFNPNRMVKARLGDIAELLSSPANETDAAKLARLAPLRKFITKDVHVVLGKNAPELHDAVEVAFSAAALGPSRDGVNVDFVNADVNVNSADTARAFVTAEVTYRDPQTGSRTQTSREVTFSFVKQDGAWLVREAEVKDLPKTP